MPLTQSASAKVRPRPPSPRVRFGPASVPIGDRVAQHLPAEIRAVAERAARDGVREVLPARNRGGISGDRLRDDDGHGVNPRQSTPAHYVDDGDEQDGQADEERGGRPEPAKQASVHSAIVRDIACTRPLLMSRRIADLDVEMGQILAFEEVIEIAG